MKKVYSISESRKIIGDLVNQVKYQNKIIAIGSRGKADALLIPNIEIDQNDDLPISKINTDSSSFNFLSNEPDIYSLQDLKKRYV